LFDSFLVELSDFVVFRQGLLPCGRLCEYVRLRFLASSTLLSFAYFLFRPSQLTLDLLKAIIVLPCRGDVVLRWYSTMPLLLVRFRAFDICAGIRPSIAPLSLNASSWASWTELEVLSRAVVLVFVVQFTAHLVSLVEV